MVNQPLWGYTKSTSSGGGFFNKLYRRLAIVGKILPPGRRQNLRLKRFLIEVAPQFTEFTSKLGKSSDWLDKPSPCSDSEVFTAHLERPPSLLAPLLV
jgi:hypothetical protein